VSGSFGTLYGGRENRKPRGTHLELSQLLKLHREDTAAYRGRYELRRHRGVSASVILLLDGEEKFVLRPSSTLHRPISSP